jgi:hypothetical protein
MADKDPSRQPSHRAYSVIKREGQDDFWLSLATSAGLFLFANLIGWSFYYASCGRRVAPRRSDGVR